MLFDHQTRIQLNQEHIERLRLARAHAPAPHRPRLELVGELLIRAGKRLAQPEQRRSGLAHEALPRC
jgi:hypothetical protein